MTNTQQNLQMQDCDLIADILMSEKQLCSTYNIATTEACTSAIRTGFKNILNDELDLQNNIFTTMNQKGWYQVDPAEQPKIQQTKTKFTQTATTMS